MSCSDTRISNSNTLNSLELEALDENMLKQKEKKEEKPKTGFDVSMLMMAFKTMGDTLDGLSSDGAGQGNLSK